MEHVYGRTYLLVRF